MAEKKVTIETKEEVIYKYTLNGSLKKNLAGDSNTEEVYLVYEGLDAQDKPSTITLNARDRNNTSVAIKLSIPKKPWDTGVDPEAFKALLGLIEEKRFDEINNLFLIQKKSID